VLVRVEVFNLVDDIQLLLIELECAIVVLPGMLKGLPLVESSE